MEKQPMVILTGPTAVGKTNLSIELAKRITGGPDRADSCGKDKTVHRAGKSHKRRNPVGRFHAGI